jgi:uncharacterized protein (TIGR02594 family)
MTEVPAPTTAPAPLDTMHAILGTKWSTSDGENPTINGWLSFVGTSFPEMADYCTGETHIGYFSWCGCTVGYCVAKSGVRPVYTKGVDTKSFLWAQAWLDWGTPVTAPQPGDVLVFDFGHGDHHVTLFDHDNGNGTWACLGGNQDHQVMVSNFWRSQCIGIRRLPAAGAVQTTTGTSIHPEVKLNDVGSVVSELQHLLGVTVDGEFGPETDAAVRAYQATHGLDVDGDVGDETWAALLAGKPATAAGVVITTDTINRIVQLAGNSDLASHSWSGRGAAPPGYIKGMAVAYANVYAKWKKGDTAAAVMTAPNSGDGGRDALAWYDAQFAALGLGNGPDQARNGDVLRHLFVLLTGLGMRESSGRCCEGRDLSASNTTADTAEAGLFQQSWNSRFASPELPKLFAEYSANQQGLYAIFSEGVTPHAGDLDDFGSGDGAAFQALCKSCPAFAVEAAAVGLRTIRTDQSPGGGASSRGRPLIPAGAGHRRRRGGRFHRNQRDHCDHRDHQHHHDHNPDPIRARRNPQTPRRIGESHERHCRSQPDARHHGSSHHGARHHGARDRDDVARRHRAHRDGHCAARPGRRDVFEVRQPDRPNPGCRVAAAAGAGRADHHPPRPDRRHVVAIRLDDCGADGHGCGENAAFADRQGARR